MKKAIKKEYNKKVYFLLATVGVLLFAVVVMWGNGYRFPGASANPDYICVKNADMSCSYTPSNLCNSTTDVDCCHAWGTDGQRICRGTKVTSVFYYLRRTTCESGYSRIFRGTDSGGDSGRLSGDRPYTSTGCTVVEVDHVEPIGIGISQ